MFLSLIFFLISFFSPFSLSYESKFQLDQGSRDLLPYHNHLYLAFLDEIDQGSSSKKESLKTKPSKEKKSNDQNLPLTSNSQSFFKQIWDKTKSKAYLLKRKLVNFISAKSKEQKRRPTQLADEACSKAPQITEAVVFQSVEAPQIDMPVGNMNASIPLAQYDQYDLVKGKTAVVLVDVQGDTALKGDKTFKLSLKIKTPSNNKGTVFSECLEFVVATQGRGNPSNSRFCSFAGNHLSLRDTLQKVLLFPKDIKTGRNFRAFIQLSHKGKVCSEKTFSFNVHSTRPLSLAFSGIKAEHCKRGLITDWQKMQVLKDSDETQKYIPAMFPVVDFLASDPITEELIVNPEEYSWIKGECGKSSFWRPFSVGGLIQDIRKALEKRNRIGMEKLILVVPRMYFEYHGKDKDTVGLVVRGAKKRKAFWVRFGSIPSHHIAFISEGYGYNVSMENKGVISHEIGHTLGQLVEFYGKDVNGNGIRDTFEYCKEVWNGSTGSCREHEIQRAFSNVEDYRGIIVGRSSIMSNVPYNRSNWMQDKWIDRDSYQKSFRYLKRPDKEQQEGMQWLDRLFGERKDIVSFSGLYIKKEERFILNPDEYYPTARGSKGGFVTEDYPLGDLLIELKHRQNVISSLRFETDMEIEFLGAGGSSQTQKLDIVPVAVSLPVGDDYYENRELEVVVSKTDNRGNKSRELFDVHVSDWQR